MSAYPLFIEFSRFACENKLTLSVFVNMSFKISKHISKCKIICDIRSCVNACGCCNPEGLLTEQHLLHFLDLHVNHIAVEIAVLEQC